MTRITILQVAVRNMASTLVRVYGIYARPTSWKSSVLFIANVKNI